MGSRAEEQERLRRQNEDDLAKLQPKPDGFSLRNKYLSKLGAQLPDNYSSCLSTMVFSDRLSCCADGQAKRQSRAGGLSRVCVTWKPPLLTPPRCVAWDGQTCFGVNGKPEDP
ncbi:hypothetical protein AV530_001718 [Patagioenas fasciata monilis]|uniref:Uncharacterized protein n=1 Tax=Patagioenas fasciata monilis TaxID=372326 RepID=A0A1V4KM54_PATFA|nr:hypothetical protein AV530_001718 [Patagioenas fasciata monilis]